MSDDPVRTDPDKYEVIFENDRVRVLEYRDVPGGHGTGSRLLAAGPDPRGREHRHHAHARAVSSKAAAWAALFPSSALHSRASPSRRQR